MVGRALAAAMVVAVFPVAEAMAQAAGEQRVQIRPDPEDIVSLISSRTTPITYIPLEDVALILGSRLEFDEARNRYAVQSVGDGLFELTPRGMEKCCDEESGALQGNVEQIRTGDDGTQLTPGASARLSNTSAQLLRSSQGTAASVARSVSFAIGDLVVSRGIITINGTPYMPLGDLSATMGIVVVERPLPDGRMEQVFVHVEGATPMLRPSQRGIIIINSSGGR